MKKPNYEKIAYDLVLSDQPNGVKIVRTKEQLEEAASRRTSLWQEIKECLVVRGHHVTSKIDSSDLIGDVARTLDELQDRVDKMSSELQARITITLSQKRYDMMVHLIASGRLRPHADGGCWQLLNCKTQEWENRESCSKALDEVLEKEEI